MAKKSADAPASKKLLKTLLRKKPAKAAKPGLAAQGTNGLALVAPPAAKKLPKLAPAKRSAASKSSGGKSPATKSLVSKSLVSKSLAKKLKAKPRKSGAAVLDRLFAVVTERRAADPATSHSARLLSRGTAKVAQKFGEEAVECLIEAVADDPAALVGESADVLYHLVVMWVAAGVAPDQVWAELKRREGISGLAEKAARAGPAGTSKIP